jgi:hypothetical protein
MSTLDNQTAADAPGACQHLRSKGMYITGCQNPAVEDGQVGDGHCWCSVTQHALGPDDNFVDRSLCIAGRRCFVASI